MRRLATIALALLVTGMTRTPDTAAVTGPERGAGPTPPRLSFIDGDVSFWRPGAEDWAPAKVNTPLAAGDSLYTGDNANLELQVGPSAFIRAGAGTDLGLESLESDLLQLKVTSGHAAVDVRRLPRGRAIEIDTPNGAFTMDHPGYYRIDIDQDRTTFSSRRGGQATVVPANGEATDVEADKQVVLEGSDTPTLATSAAPDPDDWDRWNLDRGAPTSEPSRSARYVSPEVAGSEDLDRYGDWRETPRYGPVWVPQAVAPDWVPYSTGRWVWDPYYGWTWVDDAPWGWAPYHYGRWVSVGGVWGWAPGPVVVAPVYAPALVAFFGPHVSVSVGLPFVSWVALGFGEPLIPWWGPVGFVGSCWWGGWGGPHIVNNVVIQKNVFVNVRNVTVFRNQTVHGAVIGVHRDHFGQGHVEHVHLTADDARHLRPIRGQLGVKPTPGSLVAREGHAIRPPQAAHARPVVATRPPQDLSRRLQTAGLHPGASASPPRLVPAPRGNARVRQAPVVGRATPPPPPRADHHRMGQTATRPAPPPHQARAERPGMGPARERRGQPSSQHASREPSSAAHGPRQGPPSAPRHAEGQRPEPPSPPRHVAREAPGRSAPPGRAPRAYAPSGPAPHRNRREAAPGGSPSARRDSPVASAGPPPHAVGRRPTPEHGPSPSRSRAGRPHREASNHPGAVA